MQERYVCLWRIERFDGRIHEMKINGNHLNSPNLKRRIFHQTRRFAIYCRNIIKDGPWSKDGQNIYLSLRDSRFMDAIIRVSKNINASGIINLASFCFNSIRQRQRIDGREIYSLDPKTVLFTINQNLKKENAHTHTHTHIHTSHDETNHDQSNR